jgi:DNA (cytosine-5)-methyltransferase 1
MDAVDLFAGAGGFSTGAAAAGARVLLAANHWPLAVETHRRNHPGARHLTQDLQQARWRLDVPRHDLLLASPACQGHSRARGQDRPHHDDARATAWAVVSCLEAHSPAVAIVENVPEFRQWSLYPAWACALTLLGYSVAEHLVCAADLGVPQTRRRLFVVLAQSRAPLHLRLPVRAQTPAASILDSDDAHRWQPVARPGRSANTLRRVERGRAEHGERFLVSYYGSTTGGRALSLPLGTVTTRARWALVDGERMRMLAAGELARAMGFPSGYWLPSNEAQAIHLLGNAVCPPVAEALVRAVMEVA